MNTTTQPQVAQQGPVADPLAAMSVSSVSANLPMVVQPIKLTTIKNRGSLINTDLLPAEEIAEIEKLAQSEMIQKPSDIDDYASEVQQQYTDGAKQLLGLKTVGETGMAELIASDLKLSVETVQAAMAKYAKKGDNDVGAVKKFFRNLPLIGEHLTTAEVIIASKQKLTTIFEKMEISINNECRKITEGEVVLDKSEEHLKNYVFFLRRWVLAGEIIVLRMVDAYEARRLQIPKENPDPQDVTELNKAGELITGFEVCVIGLKNAYVKAANLLPAQIAGIGGVSRTRYRDLMRVKKEVLPDLMLSTVQLGVLVGVDEAAQVSREIKEQANLASAQVGELLSKVAIEAKQTEGEALDDAQRLKGLLEKMTQLGATLATLDEQNVVKRRQAEETLIESQAIFQEAQRKVSEHFLTVRRGS